MGGDRRHGLCVTVFCLSRPNHVTEFKLKYEYEILVPGAKPDVESGEIRLGCGKVEPM